MKIRYFFILLAVIAAGCISPQIQPGNPKEYELPGLINTTIFYLNGSSVQVVENVVNTTSFRLDAGDSGEMNFMDPVAVDYYGNNVSFNISKEIFFGKTYTRFDFESPYTGFVAFTQPQADGQEFTRILMNNNSVRIVLPANFTTGSRFLGIAQPEPDNATVDASGRMILIWDNPYPANKRIKVNYYHENARDMLAYFAGFLIIAAFLICGYYYFSIRSLRKKREMMEKGKVM